MKRYLLTVLWLFVFTLFCAAQSMKGRVYYGEDIMNQGTEKSDVDASVRLEFVSDTEVRQTPTIKAKPDANFMLKFGLKMAQKKMAKAIAEKPLLKYTQKGNVITVIGGGQRGKGDAVYVIQNEGKSLRCNDGKKEYTLQRVK